MDISTHQKASAINYDKLAKQIDYVILRVGGTGYGINPPHTNNFFKDEQFENHYREFTKSRIPIGVYFYGGAVNTVEVDKEIAILLAATKDKKIEYSVYYDVEENRNHVTLGKAARTAIVKDWCTKVEKLGYYTGIYVSLHWTRSMFNYDEVSNFDLWLALWGVNEPSRSCGMWQYSSDGVLVGYIGRLDVNIAYRDFKKLITDGGLNHLFNKPVEPEKPPIDSETPSSVIEQVLKVGDKFIFPKVYTIDSIKEVKGKWQVFNKELYCWLAIEAVTLSRADGKDHPNQDITQSHEYFRKDGAYTVAESIAPKRNYLNGSIVPEGWGFEIDATTLLEV